MVEMGEEEEAVVLVGSGADVCACSASNAAQDSAVGAGRGVRVCRREGRAGQGRTGQQHLRLDW